ncbi:MAG: PDR/VanB family oxidoreductase [Phreatobacter sp.]
MRYANRWRSAEIRRLTDLGGDIRLFEIVPEDGEPGHSPPGAHLRVNVLAAGRPDTRCYSLVGAPRPDAYRIAVKRHAESRGGSAYLWSLQPGARLTITDPQSLFEPDYGTRQVLLIAGGIGVTPMVGMAETLVGRGAAVSMLYSGRLMAGMPFRDRLTALLGDRLRILASAEGERRRIDFSDTFAGLPAEAHVMICGPMPMIDDARRAWRVAGRAPAGLRFETFGSSGRHAPVPFTVRIAETGQAIEVAANASMLDALAAAGIEIMSDCRRGECGLCAVDVVAAEGEIDHRDVFFGEHEHASGRKICACVSRIAGGAVTIDTGMRPDVIRT